MATTILEVPGLQYGHGQTVIVGSTERGRLISKTELSVDFTVTNVEVNCNTLTGVADSTTPLIIRVYQEGSENDAALIEVIAVGRSNTPMNIPIKSSNGLRTLVIDAFDPSTDPNNTAGMTGSISVNGQPIVDGSGAATAGSSSAS